MKQRDKKAIKKPRKNRYLLITICFSIFIFSIFFNSFKPIANEPDIKINHIVQETLTEEDKRIEPPKPENPLIKIYADYIKSRYTKISTDTAKKIAAVVIAKSEEHRISSILVMGIIEKESSFNPTQKSHKGARGLMQLYKCDGVKIDPSKAHDISYNIETGIRIYKIKYGQGNGTISSALGRYYGAEDDDYINGVYSNVGRLSLFVDKIKASIPAENIALYYKESHLKNM